MSSLSDRVLPDLPRHDQWRRLDGVVLLDKPVGITSNQALQWVRRLLAADKGGHTGTLDPFATGVLPLCLGEATKFSADLLNADKSYEATLRFGVRTDTGDLTGVAVAETAKLPTPEQLELVTAKFLGNIFQIPPMFSALKRDGQPLYKLARQGIEVERQPRNITIHSLSWTDFAFYSDGQVGLAKLSVRCGKGTYIRTLAEDIALAVGSMAHLVGLRRTKVGAVTLEGCHTVTELVKDICALPMQGAATAVELQVAGLMQPADFLVQDLPHVALTDAQALRCRHGNPCDVNVGQLGEYVGQVRLYHEKRFLGVANVSFCQDESGKIQKIQPVRLVSTENS